MTNGHTPFRYDYVGSFLRPQKLLDAREKFSNKEITHDELKAIEDEAILDLIAKLKKAGYHVITDGEFRRAWFHLDFFWGLHGISYHSRPSTKPILDFKGSSIKLEEAVLSGKISGENHPFVEHFKFVKAQEDENTVAKQTIPSPTQLLWQLSLPEFAEANKKIYPNVEDLKDDIVKAYRQVISDLYDAGCRNVQLDDATWTLYADKSKWNIYHLDDEKYKVLAESFLEFNNRVLADWPKDLVINVHVCRGNVRSHGVATGGYDLEAPYLFNENANAFYLEYDDERSGNFEPLKYVPEGKKVVLGLITSKRPELEDEETVIRRIHEAAKYVPLENLYLSPQCGFATTKEGNLLTEEQQFSKLALVKKIAEEVWDDADRF